MTFSHRGKPHTFPVQYRANSPRTVNLPKPLRNFLTVLPVEPVTCSQIRTILPFSPAAPPPPPLFFAVPVHVFVILYNSL